MKLLPLLLMGSGLIAGAYPKFKPQPFDMVNVRFCPETSNTSEAIAAMKRQGRDIKEKDFTPQDKAQGYLYQTYCRQGHVMLKSYWEEKQSAIDLSVSPSALVTKTVVNAEKGQDVGFYLLSIVLVGTGYGYQKKHYDAFSRNVFGKIKQIENDVILTANNGNRSRQYNREMDNQTWDIKEEVAGLISREAIQNRQVKQALFQEEEFKTHLLNLNLQQSEAQKAIAQNQLDRTKAEKEMTKLQSTTSSETRDAEGVTDKVLVIKMVDALKSHEGGWLWRIIDNQTPLWLIGRQGSSKTWTACSFALIRKYCLAIPVRYLIDEHARGVNGQIWKYLDAQTVTSDIDAMGNLFDSIVANWKLRIEGKNEREEKTDIAPEQIIVDEYTALKSEVGEPSERFYRRHLKDTRKAQSYVIGVTHNDTNSSYPEGTKEQRESGTILIQKFSANGKTPLARVKVVRGLFDDAGNELLEHEGEFLSGLTRIESTSILTASR
ncbi:MAG: hypothetical protein V7L29_03675 [Nostoc sp.]|uniref:hypothetical protein n=1 Tax=Nostoc sp. TaxID=1180 RepID=UPI002FF99945